MTRKTGRQHRTVGATTWLVGAIALVVWGNAGRAETPDERHPAEGVQAAYIRHLAHFTAWPEKEFQEDDTPIVIGVVGEDLSGVSDIIQTRLAGKGLAAQNRRIELRRLSIPDDPEADGLRDRLPECHLLFIPNSESNRWPALSRLVAGSPVVTVGNFEGFSRCGGMIEFVQTTSPVHMLINLVTLRRAQLDLSSKVLVLGVVTIVETNCPNQGNPG